MGLHQQISLTQRQIKASTNFLLMLHVAALCSMPYLYIVVFSWEVLFASPQLVFLWMSRCLDEAANHGIPWLLIFTHTLATERTTTAVHQTATRLRGAIRLTSIRGPSIAITSTWKVCFNNSYSGWIFVKSWVSTLSSMLQSIDLTDFIVAMRKLGRHGLIWNPLQCFFITVNCIFARTQEVCTF